MTNVRSAIFANDSLWVTITNVCLNSSRNWKNNSCNSCAFLVSKFPDGSSAKITAGWFIKERHTATRCCSPPDSSEGLWEMRCAMFSFSNRKCARSSASFLFFPPAIYFILFIFIALSILRTYSIKERIMVVCGFIVPPFFAGIYYYWQNSFDLFYKLQFTGIFNIPTFTVTPFEYINLLLYFVFICLVLFLIFSYNKIAYRKIIQSRKRINIMYWILGITFMVLFILPKQGNDVYLLLSLPLGLLTSLGFISMKPNLAEIFHFVLILGLLVSHNVGLFL